MYKIPNSDLVESLQQLRSIMITVSTGRQQIDEVKQNYKSLYDKVDSGLSKRSIKNSILFNDLWAWYGKWSDGSLPTYQSRRTYVSQIFDALDKDVKKSDKNPINPVFNEPTGWMRVDRGISEIKLRLIQASNEEQFQSIGLLSRETLISLAQAVYEPEKHKTDDGTIPSNTDAKRMLDAYISTSISGSTHENIRKYAKSSLALANDLTHRRTADFRLAALCAEATSAVINVISIISGRRDPIS